MNKTKYFLYARKSTQDDNRQVMSIEAQLFELKEYVRVDGGRIIYAVDQKNIVSLCFSTFWFEPTPQGLFMLQVAFGQSK